MNNNKMKACKKIFHKNIRATALDEFWGTEYTDSLYLWEGAKHPLTLREMEKITEETLDDLFAAQEDIVTAREYCQQVYYRILPKLAMKLNEISGVSLPDTFWRSAFGFWLFRHICITFEKYSYLSKIDIDQTSIKLLNKDSFYIPYDHYDYVYCFCNDFGVQQLVSQYYYLYKNIEFSSISMQFDLTLAKRKRILDYGKGLLRKALNALAMRLSKNVTDVEPRVVLCGVYNTSDVASALFSRSKGMISPISPPPVSTDHSVNTGSRKKLLDIESENDFEHYLVQTFYYCFPQMFIEHFRDYYDVFLRDIKSKRFTQIVSESWISDIRSSIYCAIAQQQGRRFICYEHGSGTVFDKTFRYWIETLVADRYITVGWKISDNKLTQGGFICRDIKPYQFQPTKKNILYIARTNFPYLMEFDIYNAPNTICIKALKRVRDFCDLLPEFHRSCFILRPRREDHFWNTEHTLEIIKKNIQVDTGNFSDSITNARIIIIDHLSTGAAEILLMKVPCLIIQNEQHISRSEEINGIFDELINCGVMHTSAQSAVTRLANIYDDVQFWWNSEAVKVAVNKLISKTLAPPSKTIDYLLSCLPK